MWIQILIGFSIYLVKLVFDSEVRDAIIFGKE